jgi:hypothetical protein
MARQGFSMSTIAGSRAVSRPVGVSWINTAGALPANRNSYSGPIVSRNNPVAVQGFRNFDTMANNRTFTRGYAHPSTGGYNDSYNQMRTLVHIGEGHRVNVRDAMNRDLAMRRQPTKVIYKTRPGTSFTAGGFNPTSGQAVNQNAWRSQQNSSGLGRNRGYSSGMSQFAINNSANSGLNRMR